jgi:ribosomal protein S18 acetylase RimI-like enzyme
MVSGCGTQSDFFFLYLSHATVLFVLRRTAHFTCIVYPMNIDDLLYLSDLNLAESIREMTRWQIEGQISEQHDLLITKSTDASPVTNCVIRTGPYAKPAADSAMELIQNYYDKYNSGFSIYIRSHVDADLKSACESLQMIKVSDAPGMVIDTIIPESPHAESIDIREATDLQGAADFATVAIESYQSLGMRAEIGNRIFATPERMLKPHMYMVVGYANGVPSSCAFALFSHSIAGVYWVGTASNARGRGLAEACTRAVANKALERGASAVVLQASKFGEPIYRRMGFTEFTRYPWYMYFNRK